MKNLSCIIVDDEDAAIEVLSGYVSKIEFLILKETFSSPIKAISYVQENDIDLVFLDINMPNISGIGFLELLKGKSKVILTTAYADYALEGYKYDVVDYLTKPIAFDSFFKASQKAKDRFAGQKEVNNSESLNDYIIVKTDHKGKFAKILYSEIMYIESMKNYVAIYTKQREQIITLLSLKELEERLPAEHFYRTHKSYILALNQLKIIDGGEIVLQNEKDRIPLGITYRDSFFEFLENKMLKQ
jgi:two-component system LytT family response regulator